MQQKILRELTISIKKAEGDLCDTPISSTDLAVIILNLEKVLCAIESLSEQSKSRLKVLANAAMAHARLEQFKSHQTNDVDDIIQLLEATLEICYEKNHVTDYELSKVRLLTALAYDIKINGVRSENIEQVISMTDSLDLNRRGYFWPLSRILRAKAYRDRNTASSTPFDNSIARHLLEEAIKCSRTRGTRELRAEAHMELGKLFISMDQADDKEEPSLIAERHLCKALKFFRSDVRPIRYAEVNIALGKTYVRRYVEQGRSCVNAKKAFQYFERARAHLSGPIAPRLLAEADVATAKIYSLRGPFYSTEKEHAAWESAIVQFQQSADIEVSMVGLSKYGMLLFSKRLWSKSAEILRTAVFKVETLLDEATLLSSRRDAVRHLSELTNSLAYCEMELGQFEQAFLSLERGKARLLSEVLLLVQFDRDMAKNSGDQELSTMSSRILELEGRQYGGMYFTEDLENLNELRQKSRHPTRLSETKKYGLLESLEIRKLTPSQSGYAVIASMLTIHGGAFFVIKHGDSRITQSNVIKINNLTSHQLRRWLTEDGALSKSWFGAYEARVKSVSHQHRWKVTIELLCKRLGDVFIKELSNYLKFRDIHSIVFVVGGGLQFFPLHACPSDSDGNCLLDNVTVSYAPSAYVAALSSRRQREMSFNGQYLLAGVSKYEGVSDLPHVKSEMGFIEHLLEVQAYLNGDVSQEVFSYRAPNSSIIHFACHGTAWFSDPMFRFSWEPQPALRFVKGGLAFADILGTKLLQAPLVILSACDSGSIDRTLSWDEFEGLPHVFLQAGASNIVSTIWSVNDCSTSLVMQRFYSNLILDKKPPMEALRDAQLWLRNATRKNLCEFLRNSAEAGTAHALETYTNMILGGEMDDRPYNHPFYWAPFIVTGG